MFERLTDNARKVMALANQEAQRFNHDYIGTEHILLGVVKHGSCVGAQVLTNRGIDLRKVRLEVEKLLKYSPDMLTMGELPQTSRSKKVIEYAIEEARSFNHRHVGTEHLLLGLLREGQGVAWHVLQNVGVITYEVARSEVIKIMSEYGEVADDARGPLEPFQVPQTSSLVDLRDSPGMAYLADERGNQISLAMRIELAQEIVKRYNAQ